MAVGNTAKSNGRGGKATTQRSRASRSAKTEATAVTSNGTTLATPSEHDPSTVEESGTETAPVAETTEENVMSEDAMSTEGVVKLTARPAQGDDQQAAIALHEPVSMVWNRPVMPSDFEVAETMSVAGIRPIEVSHLELAGSFLNGRPIEASSLHVHHMLPGNRPIFDSQFKMVEDGMLPGNRPILASSPELLEGSLLPGGRPIASNEVIDPDPSVLMGYLD